MHPHLIACVVGARPNFIKMAAIYHELLRRPRFSGLLIHTGQHYSPDMSQTFFDELRIPPPDVNLEAGGGTHTQQTAEIMRRLEPLLLERKPAMVLVVGDVNSTLATSLVAAKLGIPIAHVEAGLRSFDRSMPEEINRLVTDTLSTYLFVSEPSGIENLLREGVPDSRVFFTGNVMIDTLLRFRDKAASSNILPELGLAPRGYGVITLHRPSNVDEPARLERLLAMLAELGRDLPLVFPIHPRTRQSIEAAGLSFDHLQVIPPLGYLDFLRLMSQARLVLTDSGGIQEETTILQVPCLTLRENTERPVTITSGSNRLVGTDPDAILAAARHSLASTTDSCPTPELWDGQAARRIFDVLERELDSPA